MRRVVFAGPSLYGIDTSGFGIETRPPIQAGDVLTLLESGPAPGAVLVIDGIFGAGQAISVAELRELPRRGVALFGASSMGALRAADGRGMGIQPLGGIAGEYVAGARTNDADVALLHDQAGRALTMPTVNVESLARLLILEGVAPECALDFLKVARRIHFTERTPAKLCSMLKKAGVDPDSEPGALLGRPRLWDRKASDALDALLTFVEFVPDDLARLTQRENALAELVPWRTLAQRSTA